jgi:pyruvate,water dikinase
LQNYPQPIVDQFELLLKAAQVGKVLGEDHGFWIDFRGMYRVRRVMLEFGRRFAAAGIIEHRDDIFYLTLDEIRAMAATPPKRDQYARVAGRRAEMKYYRTITPPPVLGTIPSGPPPDDPISRFAGKFFGTPPQPASEPNSVSGNAGSPGIATGPARIIRSLADAARLQPGDILVTETTAPPWTPLFATAAAVVTDTGGILSHCAVVAREYGIPAVVGTGMATTAIHDGQLLEVNGDTGIVRIIDEA